MTSKIKPHIVLVAVLLILSMPLLFFNKISYAEYDANDPNNNWEVLVENICGESRMYYDYEYREECIAGIGMTDAFCNSLFKNDTQEMLMACKFAVYWTNINRNHFERAQWVTENCMHIYSYKKNDRTVYKCQAENWWQNQQGYCIITGSYEAVCVPYFNVEGESETDYETRTGDACVDSSNSIISWIYCPITDVVSGFVDALTNWILVPMLEWRIIV